MESLNSRQKEAVNHIQGPLRIIAGAGSGKTRVLIYKILHLLKNDVLPAEICLITFTNKATNELKERILDKVGQHSQVWISTYHSLCTRILRDEIDRLGYENNFNIIDSREQIGIITTIYRKLFGNNKSF